MAVARLVAVAAVVAGAVVLGGNPWFAPRCAAAAERGLYYSDYPTLRVPEYAQILHQLRAGETLHFIPELSHPIHDVLGEGNTTKIADIGGGRALRIPIADGYFTRGGFENRTYDDFLLGFVSGYRQLEGSGIPIVHLYEKESRPPMYLVVENIPTRGSLADFMAGRIQLTSAERRQAFRQLEAWAATTWAFREIGDFNASQLRLAADPARGWVLLDFTEAMIRARSVAEGTIFEQRDAELTAEFRDWLSHCARLERARHDLP